MASSNRKNGNAESIDGRKAIGRRIDGIAYSYLQNIELGVFEGARENMSPNSEKYKSELFKLPKTLKDIMDDIKNWSQISDASASELQVFGVLHMATHIQFARMWQYGKNVYIFYLEPKVYAIEPQFSGNALGSFLQLLAKVYRCKVNEIATVLINN